MKRGRPREYQHDIRCPDCGSHWRKKNGHQNGSLDEMWTYVGVRRGKRRSSKFIWAATIDKSKKLLPLRWAIETRKLF